MERVIFDEESKENSMDVFKGKFYPAFFLQLLYKLGILFIVIFLIFSKQILIIATLSLRILKCKLIKMI